MTKPEFEETNAHAGCSAGLAYRPKIEALLTAFCKWARLACVKTNHSTDSFWRYPSVMAPSIQQNMTQKLDVPLALPAELVGLPHYIAICAQFWSELGWVFRGQTKGPEIWPLLPKAGRPKFFISATDHWKKVGQSSGDLGRFREWRKNAIAFCDSVPSNDFDCLAFAQHYGLATRLLDWSTNPLVALFFAVETDLDTDGAVFCHNPEDVIDRDNTLPMEDYKTVAKFYPSPLDRRIVAQSSVFTFHPRPEEPLTVGPLTAEQRDEETGGVTENLKTIVIPAALKFVLQRQLRSIGVSRKSLFPDLEGLSSFINWSTQRYSDISNDKSSQH